MLSEEENWTWQHCLCLYLSAHAFFYVQCTCPLHTGQGKTGGTGPTSNLIGHSWYHPSQSQSSVSQEVEFLVTELLYELTDLCVDHINITCSLQTHHLHAKKENDIQIFFNGYCLFLNCKLSL